MSTPFACSSDVATHVQPRQQHEQLHDASAMIHASQPWLRKVSRIAFFPCEKQNLPPVSSFVGMSAVQQCVSFSHFPKVILLKLLKNCNLPNSRQQCTWKYRYCPKGVRVVGAPLVLPGYMSLTRTVPASVPSVLHSSAPWLASVACKAYTDDSSVRQEAISCPSYFLECLTETSTTHISPNACASVKFSRPFQSLLLVTTALT